MIVDQNICLVFGTCMEQTVKNNEAINPSSDTIKRCEIYKALSDDDSAKYTKLWQELLSY